jgi:GNAT superfamily N-acetyltransferase
MCYDLTKELPELDLSKCYIKEVTGEQDLKEWKIPLDEGFKTDKNEQSGYFERVRQIPYGKGQAFHHYVAYVNEKPVSCATLSISKYGARIDNVATCDAYVGQGFAKAVTIFAMKEANKFGCKMVCLESSDEGLPLYSKIGFKEIYKNREFMQYD